MPVPWVQIVRLMPSIIEVSQELLKRSRRTAAPAQPGAVAAAGGASKDTLEARIAALEENERRQAELVKAMADQLSQLATALTVLHRQTRWLIAGQIVTAAIAVAAIVVAWRAVA